MLIFARIHGFRTYRKESVSYPKWQFWKWLGREAAIHNIEREAHFKLVQRTRADIVSAKVRAANQSGEHHKFLHACHNHLEQGLVPPSHISGLIKKYNAGDCPIACKDVLHKLARSS